jgi:hypothetical protein
MSLEQPEREQAIYDARLKAERDQVRAALITIVENVDGWGIAQLRAYIRKEGRAALGPLPWAKAAKERAA